MTDPTAPDPRASLMDIIRDLAELADRARADNHQTLAYLIDMARIEAEGQKDKLFSNVVPIWPPLEK